MTALSDDQIKSIIIRAKAICQSISPLSEFVNSCTPEIAKALIERT